MNELHIIAMPSSDITQPDTATCYAPQVEQYLEQNPDFFQTREALLTQMNFPQSSGGTLSLATRQAEIMREKIRVSEKALHELHVQAHANEQRAQKIHRMALVLLRTPQPDMALRNLSTQLTQEFDLASALLHLELPSHSAVLRTYPNLSDFIRAERIWQDFGSISSPTIPRMNNELRELMLKHNLPETGSIAIIPLSIKADGMGLTEDLGGTLLLVKREPHGFSPDMGSLFLQQIGDLLRTALERYASDTH